LRQAGRIFVSTAGRTDILLLDWAAGKLVFPPKKVFLYFHWFRDSDKKRRQLAKIALRQPNIVILGPTPSVVEVFRACGFSSAAVVPYPITPTIVKEEDYPVSFRYILFAGAARKDKGFGAVVDLVALLAEQGQSIPIRLQCSAEHYDKYDACTREDLVRLAAISYPLLETVTKTLSSTEYRALFTGGICLQPYEVKDFADRISGVTLDALSAGCPLVTVAGTWMSRIVERFGAGVVLDDADPTKMLAAVRSISADYASFRNNALNGGRILQEEMSAFHLFQILTSPDSGVV
jgi:glycosyltransferase involved in cell wall biosynthesis